MMPATTATPVASSLPSSPSNPMPLSVSTTSPLSARMIFQDRVRRRKGMRKGMSSITSRKFLNRPPRKAMK